MESKSAIKLFKGLMFLSTVELTEGPRNVWSYNSMGTPSRVVCKDTNMTRGNLSDLIKQGMSSVCLKFEFSNWGGWVCPPKDHFPIKIKIMV